MFERYASRPQVTRYLGWPTHSSVEATRAFVASDVEAWARDGMGSWLVFETVSGALLGSTGLHAGEGRDAATGYLLVPEAWRKGFATEVLAAVVEQARAVGVRRLTASVHPDNRASVRVLEKVGFVPAPELGAVLAFPNLDASRPLPVLWFSKVLDADDPAPFATLEEGMRAVEARFASDVADWRLTHTSIVRDGEMVVLRGALPQTMHFGTVSVDLQSGAVRVVDEDHRDGGDLELRTGTLAEAWTARLRELAKKG
jgi:RimJ/RimL family protein N-acetyltransferase